MSVSKSSWRSAAAAATILCAIQLASAPARAKGGVPVDCGAGDDLQAAINTPGVGLLLVISGTCHGSFTIPAGKVLSLRGAGDGSAVLDGGGASRVLTIEATASASLYDLTIRNGNADLGGGIRNTGALYLTRVTVSGNTATLSGGGILNDTYATLTLDKVTVSGNTAGFEGGGIDNELHGVLTATNTTVSGNIASGKGGGIWEAAQTSTTLLHVTISDNTAGYEGGGIYSFGNPSLRLSLVADNDAAAGGPDCSGTMSSGGYNFVGDVAGCTWPPAIAGDQTGDSGAGGAIDPQLGPLASNGSRLQTHALLPGSGALDQLASCGTTEDERGVLRDDGSCDVGAYEARPCAATFDNGGTVYDSVQAAVDAASSGATIKIAGECRGMTVDIDGATTLTLQGGYVTTNWITSDPLTNPTFIDAAQTGRTLSVRGGAVVTVQDLTLSGGNGTGPGVFPLGASAGGALWVAAGATAELIGCTVSDSQAALGGAIYNSGSLTLVASTVTNNRGYTSSGGLQSDGALTIRNSTLSGNRGMSVGALLVNGGAATVVGTTITENQGDLNSAGAIMAPGSGTLSLGGTLVANNSSSGGARDCAGTIASAGYNLIRAAAGCSFGAKSSDLVGAIDPRLGPLVLDGGTTATRGLRPGSPAINRIPAAECATLLGASPVDQRGLSRDVGPGCDIGAFESGCGNGTLDGTEGCDEGLLVGTFSSCCALSCVYEAPGTPCDDGLFCTTGDKCDGADQCLSGGPNSCSDGIACTTDSCDENANTCDHMPHDSLCDDGLFCTGTEVCVQLLGCRSSGDPCAAAGVCSEATASCGAPSADAGVVLPDGGPAADTGAADAGVVLADSGAPVSDSGVPAADSAAALDAAADDAGVVLADGSPADGAAAQDAGTAEGGPSPDHGPSPDAVSGADRGVSSDATAARDQGAEGDAGGPDPQGDSGCGCAQAATPIDAAAAPLSLLLLAWAVTLRRRRRTRGRARQQGFIA